MNDTKKRIVLVTVTILILLVCGYVYLLLIDSDFREELQLKPFFKTIPANQNSFYMLVKASNTFSYSQKKMYSNGKQINYRYLEMILNKNRNSLLLFEKGSLLPIYLVPKEYIVNKNDSNRIINKKFVELAQLRYMKFLLHFKRKQIANAIREALLLISWGHKIQNGNGPLVNYTLGTTYKIYGYKAILQLINMNKIEFNDLKDISKQISQYKCFYQGLINSMKIEYYSISKKIDTLSDNNKNMNLLFKENATKRMFAEHIVSIITNVDKSWSFVKKMDRRGLFLLSPTYSKLFPFENMVGKKFYETHIFSTEYIYNSIYNQQFYHRVIDLLYKIKKYKNEQKELPNSLDNLIPQYAESIPSDPYDGNKMKYSKELKIIYSIGPDLVDEKINEKLKCYIKF